MSEAIVLAGGFGTRLRSVVSDVPKPMAPVGGRPFLCYLLDRLLAYGYEHVVLATGYMHSVVEGHFGSSYGQLSIDFAVEKEPLGTGGAIVNALRFCHDEEVTVLNGDTLFDVDLNHLRRFATEKRTRLAVVLRRVSDASRYGTVNIDEHGTIVGFAEKQASAGEGLINGGIYQLSKSLLEGYRVGDSFSFERDVMQRIFVSEPCYAYEAKAYFIDIGIPSDYARAQKELPRL